ncbi:MAG: flagellin, partial [Oscillospiraceae bacterium]
MVIQHNLSALTANRNRVIIENKMAKVLEKLSTAKRINTAADDASGLSVTEKMRGQINGLQRSIFNANDAISLIQTAEGGLVESHNILERMMKLAVSAANGTFDNTVDRAVLEKEFDYLQSELNTIAQNTNFNNIKPLDGSLAKPATSSNAAAKMMSATTVEGKNNFLQYEKWKATKSTYSFEKKKDGIEIQLDHNGVSSNNIKIYIDDMSSKGLKLDK